MTDMTYNPHGRLTESEVQIIGQALRVDVTEGANHTRRFASDMKAYARKNPGVDLNAVLEMELTNLRSRYDLMAKFVYSPLPWELYKEIASENWLDTGSEPE